MYIANVTIDYDNITDYYNITFTKFTNSVNEDFNIVFKYLLLSLPGSLLILSLTNLMVYTLLKTLIKTKKWRNFYTQNIPYAVS